MAEAVVFGEGLTTPENPFLIHRVPARQNLLDYAQELEPDLYAQLAADPKGWIAELSTINAMLTGDGLGAAVGMPLPEQDTEAISDDVVLCHSRDRFFNGLWIRIDGQWNHYRHAPKAVLRVSKIVSGVNPNELLPENFTETGEVVKDVKRPIIRMNIDTEHGPVSVFAKGSVNTKSYYYEHAKPQHRKTYLAGISRVNSQAEMTHATNLEKLGVHMPRTIGYYEALTEQWLFVEAVQGGEVSTWLNNAEARTKIIEQDAAMLAALCRSGYRKQGFHDFDDKIFDGESLYLIDTDELVDLYGYLNIAYRDILLDPTKENELIEFRALQRGIFLSMLKDALHEYQRPERTNLLQNKQEALNYVRAFANALGWKLSDEEYLSLVAYKDDYMTTDRYMALMSDI